MLKSMKALGVVFSIVSSKPTVACLTFLAHVVEVDEHEHGATMADFHDGLVKEWHVAMGTGGKLLLVMEYARVACSQRVGELTGVGATLCGDWQHSVEVGAHRDHLVW